LHPDAGRIEESIAWTAIAGASGPIELSLAITGIAFEDHVEASSIIT
jgi:hypothetical protein